LKELFTSHPKTKSAPSKTKEDDDSEPERDDVDLGDDDEQHARLADGGRSLDAQFETLLGQYDDEQIGELQFDDPAVLGPTDVRDVNSILDDFMTNKSKEYKTGMGSTKAEHEIKKQAVVSIQTQIKTNKELIEDDAASIATRIDAMFPVVVREKWDCESVISTYSNLENHPRLISEPRSKKPVTKPVQIKISERTGIPLGVLPSRKPAKTSVVDVNENLGKKRTDETAQEKKSRKQAVKESRKRNRERKKALKGMYASEQAMQSVNFQNQTSNPPAVRL